MNKYILSGILYCGNCSSKMIGVCEGRKGDWTGYRCKKKAREGTNACNMKNVSAIRIENAVFRDVIRFFLIPQNVRIIFSEIKEVLNEAESKTQKELLKIEYDMKKVEESIKRYTDSFEKGLLDAEYFSARNKILTNCKEDYQKRRDKLLIEIEDIKYEKINFYQFKKYLYNIKFSTENKILNDSNIKKIILKTLINGEIIESITILSPNMAKIIYNIKNQINEKIINFKSRVKSFNIDVAAKFEN